MTHPDPLAKELVRSLPKCSVTGLIAGDGDACGDCDPCIMGAHLVPAEVKALMKERDEWRGKYSDAAIELDSLQSELAALKKPVEEGEIDDHIADLEQFLGAYPIDIFPEATSEQIDACPENVPGRISAMMGRHLGKTYVEPTVALLRRLSADKARMEEALIKAQPFVRFDEWDTEEERRQVSEAQAAIRAALPKQKETL